MKFVIAGLGSIGSRHQKNLINLGHQETKQEKDADGFLICNPTALHLETALKVAHFERPIFIEKPLSHSLDGLEALRGTILVGYCLRFDQSLKEFKQKVDGLDKNKIKSVKIVCQSWLPDWRPGSDYRQSYSAKKDLGGGALLDLSHEIDYALWWFGPVKKVSAKIRQAPELNIETEAIADLKLEFVSGVKADIRLSYASHKYERFCEVKTADQTLRWDYHQNNEMYIDEIKHFIEVCQGKTKPQITIADGIKVLEVIEAAKRQ